MSDSPGILAVWNDRNPDIEAFYEDWYVNQHLPERVGLPGWRFGRRYEAMDGVTPQFFTYYETDAVADMFSDAYIARLNDPTPETVKVMQNWGNMTRTRCARDSMRGHCRGAFAVVARVYGAEAIDALEHVAMRAMDDGRALSVQVWSADTSMTLSTAESNVRETPDRAITAALVLDVMRADALAAARQWLPATLPALPSEQLSVGAYQFLCEYRAQAA